MVNIFRRNKGLDDSQKSIIYGMLSGEGARTLTEQEWREQLGINIEMITAHDTLTMLKQIRVKMVDAEYYAVAFKIATLETLLNQVMRTSRLDPDDVIIYTLQAKEIIAEIKLNLPMEFVDAGLEDVIDACEILICSGISCAEGGWMAKLMKVSPRQYEIRMGPPEKQKRE